MNLHVHRRESSVCQTTAHGSGKGESRIQGKRAHLLWHVRELARLAPDGGIHNWCHCDERSNERREYGLNSMMWLRFGEADQADGDRVDGDGNKNVDRAMQGREAPENTCRTPFSSSMLCSPRWTINIVCSRFSL